MRELGKHFGQAGLGEFFDFISHAQIRPIDFDHPREVNGSGDQHEIARSAADGFLQFVPLDSAVTHGGQKVRQVPITIVGAANGAHGIRPRIHQFCRPTLPRRDHARAIGHLSVSEGGTVLHHQHALSLHKIRLGNGNSASHLENNCLGVVEL